jgi:glycosyltransferase involved in cell wall biosynthesis
MIVYLDKSFSKWILGAIIRETATKSGKQVRIKEISNFSLSASGFFVYLQLGVLGLPVNNLIVNQNNYFSICKYLKLFKFRKNRARIFFTHSLVESLPQKQISLLNECAEIVVMNSAQKDILESLGVRNPIISICFGAINSDYFFPSDVEPPQTYVFISGDVKERKQPGKILETIRSCQEIDFLLFGHHWRDYIFQSGERLENVRIAGTSMRDNGYFMRNASCYLTLSRIEGGPYGTIEALASGTPVVCTPTGWNLEVVNKSNGVIVGYDASVTEIRAAISQAFEIKKSSIKPSLEHKGFTWENQAQVLFKGSRYDA